MTDRLLAMKDVATKLDLSKSTIYGLVRDNQFPAPVRIGAAVRWRESDVDRWIATLPTVTDLDLAPTASFVPPTPSPSRAGRPAQATPSVSSQGVPA